MLKYKIETRKGHKATLEGESMIRLIEEARQFCQSKGEGWPGSIVVWEQIVEQPIEPKRGKKYEYDK